MTTSAVNLDEDISLIMIGERNVKVTTDSLILATSKKNFDMSSSKRRSDFADSIADVSETSLYNCENNVADKSTQDINPINFSGLTFKSTQQNSFFHKDFSGFQFRPAFNASTVISHTSETDFLSPESLYRDMTGGLNPASADPVSPALKLDQDSMMSNISVDYVAKEDDQPASKFQEKRIDCPTFTTRCSYDPLMIRYIVGIILCLVYNGFLIGALLYAVERSQAPIDWRNGVGFLVVLTLIVYIGLVYNFLIKRLTSKDETVQKDDTKRTKLLESTLKWIGSKYFRWACTFLLATSVVIFLAIDTSNPGKGADSKDGSGRHRLVSLLGVGMVIVVSALVSSKPSDIRWQVVVSCCSINFLLCLAMFRSAVVPDITDCIFQKIRSCSSMARSGTQFLFGHLVLDTKITNSSQIDDDEGFIWHDWHSAYSKYSPIFFIRSMIIVYFTNFVFAILIYCKVVGGLTVNKLGTFTKFLAGTSGRESIFAVVRIFLNPLASVLCVKDFLADLTPSEMNTVITVALSGAASLDVTDELVAFWRNGGDVGGRKLETHFQLTSIVSVLSAVAVSKLVLPEAVIASAKVGEVRISRNDPEPSCSGFDFAIRSVSETSTVLVNVVGCAIAFMGCVTFCDGIIHWAGTLFGHHGLCFAELGELFLPPVLWLLGVSWEETHTVAKLVAYKMSHNELSALNVLSEMSQSELSSRNTVLTFYLICNLVHPIGLASALASITSLLTSSSTTKLTDEGPRTAPFRCLARSIFGAILATFLTTAIVGTLLE